MTIATAAFGLRSHFVTVRGSDGKLRGALPLVEQTLIPWTRCLVSLPFCTYGGPLADDDQALAALLEGAEQLAQQRQAARIILRHARLMPAIPYPVSLDKVSMILPLPDNREELARRLGSKLRSQIRRADRANPEVRIGREELVDDFYTVFCSVMRDLGTPVYPQEVLRRRARCAGRQRVGHGDLCRWHRRVGRDPDSMAGSAQSTVGGDAALDEPHGHQHAPLLGTAERWRSSDAAADSTSDAVPKMQGRTVSRPSGEPSPSSCTGTRTI